MQTNFPNKSHLIRSTEAKKKKARRRLFGSIFLLLIALAVLLRVTAHVKPIPLDPKIIEVKNTAHGAIHDTININDPQALADARAKLAASGMVASVPTMLNSSGTIKNTTSIPISSSNKVAVVNRDASSTISQNKEPSSAPLAQLKPRVVNDIIKSKPTPEDILNGNISATVNNRDYLQLLSLADKDILTKLKSILDSKGFTTAIVAVDTPTGKVYRLRMGPFNTKNEANDKLNELKKRNVI